MGKQQEQGVSAVMLMQHCFLLFLFVLTDVVWSTSGLEGSADGFLNSTESPEKDRERVCSYNDVLEYLNMTKDSNRLIMSRPVKDHTKKTYVSIEMVVYNILDMRETDQTFSSYVWVYTTWNNDFISWNPEDFCGITSVTIPVRKIWHPDIIIEEMIEKDKAPSSIALRIFSNGTVVHKNTMVILSTCKMNPFKFPFDVQSCDLSFRSNLHSDEDMEITMMDGKVTTKWSLDLIKTQCEWVFKDITSSNRLSNFDNGRNQTVRINTINMERRSVLYVANFLLPVFFFLILDWVSFLIPDDGGEKLGFKVTVLLAVTVMQLILKDILPSSTDTVPLIVIYCIGIFSMMLVSLLETILVIYLMRKDSPTQDDGNLSLPEEESTSKLMDTAVPVDEGTAELMVKKKISLFCGWREDIKLGRWTSLSRRITKAFVIVYMITSIGFLMTIFAWWIS